MVGAAVPSPDMEKTSTECTANISCYEKTVLFRHEFDIARRCYKTLWETEVYFPIRGFWARTE
jgi:hypothetical protein